MTVGPPSFGPTVDIDLQIEVDGPAGGTPAVVTGSGDDIKMWADRPDVVIATAGRRAGAGVTGLLGAARLRAELHGPRGRVLSYDPRHNSRVGGLLWGSRHLAVDRGGWPDLARSTSSWVGMTWRPRTAAFVVGLVLSVIGVTAWLNRDASR